MQKILFNLIIVIAFTEGAFADNPVIRHLYTADPAAMVYNDTFWLFTGHDEGSTGYVMNNWHIFSSTDMVNWVDYGVCMKYSQFSWASGAAWAGQCIYRNGKFYWYVPMSHKTISGKAIGVAVADKITGPYSDPKGSAIITNNMTKDTNTTWDDIDPTIFVDDDDQAYLYWGNHSTYAIKMKSNMYDTMGGIIYLTSTFKQWDYEEAPWVFKRNSIYYLAYADSFPEYIDYATSSSPLGPWTHKGRINGLISGCGTNHEAIVEYKGKQYFVYHSAGLPSGGDYKRSVCIDTLSYNADGTINPITMTTTGVAPVGPGPVEGNVKYQIVSRLTGKTLQVAASAASGVEVKQSAWAGTSNQIWYIDSVGYGVYKITNVQTGYCMEVPGGTQTTGTVIQQTTYSGAAKQQWKLVGTGDGYFAFVNKNSVMCIDIQDSLASDTAIIDQAAYGYTPNQQWQIIKQAVGAGYKNTGKKDLMETFQAFAKNNGRQYVVFSGKCPINSQVSIIDINGKIICRLKNFYNVADQAVFVMPNKLSRGAYLIVLHQGNLNVSKKLFIR